MAAIGIASRSTTSMRSIIRNATARSLISPKARSSVPNFNFTSPRFNTSSRIEGSVPRLLRRELSTQQPFHSLVAAACLVSKLPSDVTSPEGKPQGQKKVLYVYFSRMTLVIASIVSLRLLFIWTVH